jgi:soluble P-type ATPase
VIDIDVPGFGALRLRHCVLDFNGTLARDGVLIEGVGERLRALAPAVELHVVTADTTGTAREALSGLPVELQVLAPAGQARAKRRLVEALGAHEVVAIGNGRNDRAMLRHAGLSIAVQGAEGCAVEALQAAHIVVLDVRDALDLLVTPRRVIATLRD